MAAYKISNKERAKLLAHIRQNLILLVEEYNKKLESYECWQPRLPKVVALFGYHETNCLLDDLYWYAERLEEEEKIIATYRDAIRILAEARPARELVATFQRYMPNWTFKEYRRPGRRERRDAYARKHMWDGCTNMCIDYGD